MPTATSKTTVRAHPERAVPDETAAILALGLVAHVGFADGAQPVVIPMTYQFDPETPDRLYIHGGHHSRLMQHLASGASVCVTVTIVDALVYSKTALYHSVNYRSAVVFGRIAQVQPDIGGQRAALEGMIARYFPGRTAGRDYEAIPDEHLTATAFVALAIEEWSAKARRGGPKGPHDDDPDAPGTCGVATIR